MAAFISSCTQLQPYAAQVLCAHGVGHGFMSHVSYHTGEAVALCDLFMDPTLKNHCFSGVFMEEIFDATLFADRKEAPLVPCSSLHIPEDAAERCHAQRAYSMLYANGFNIRQALQECLQGPEISVRACVGGTGYFAVITPRKMPSPESILSLCAITEREEYVQECVIEASKMYLLFWNDSGAAKRMCAMAEGEEGECASLIDRLLEVREN